LPWPCASGESSNRSLVTLSSGLLAMARPADFATNVLTFGYSREPVVRDEIVLCAPVIALGTYLGRLSACAIPIENPHYWEM